MKWTRAVSSMNHNMIDCLEGGVIVNEMQRSKP